MTTGESLNQDAALPGDFTITDRLQATMGKFGPAERRVARVLISGPPTSGLETIHRLAARAQTSPATVLRCVARAGYESFPSFQQAVRRELDARLQSPSALYDQRYLGPPNALISQSSRTLSEAVRGSLNRIAPDEFRRAVEFLSDPKRGVFAFGGQLSYMLSEQLVMYLGQVRSGVRLMGLTPLDQAVMIVEIKSNDVIVIFDYRRYEGPTEEIARSVAAKGGRVILFTDRWLSPISGCADVVIAANVESMSPFDSYVGPLATLETVVAGVVAELGEAGRIRLEHISNSSIG